MQNPRPHHAKTRSLIEGDPGSGTGRVMACDPTSACMLLLRRLPVKDDGGKLPAVQYEKKRGEGQPPNVLRTLAQSRLWNHAMPANAMWACSPVGP